MRERPPVMLRQLREDDPGLAAAYAELLLAFARAMRLGDLDLGPEKTVEIIEGLIDDGSLQLVEPRGDGWLELHKYDDATDSYRPVRVPPVRSAKP